MIAVYGDYGRDATGKRVRKTFYGHTIEEANEKRAKYEHERQIGMPQGSDKITVSQWCDMWVVAYKPNLKGTNKVTYDSCLQRLKDDLGFIQIKDVHHIHLQSSLNKMAGMSTSAITKYKMVLCQVFKRARQNKIIMDDPSEDLELPDGTAGEHRALERWEAEAIARNWPIHRAGIWIMVMMFAGLRRGEMIALRWDCIDLENKTINVCRSAEVVSNQPVIKEWTKTEAGMRIVPICDALMEALSHIPPDQRRGYVCKSAHGKPISQSAFVLGLDGFNKAMERLLNGEPIKKKGGRRKKTEIEAEIKKELTHPAKERILFKVRAHDLRFTFATTLYDAGVDVKSAQYYLGHADIRMTMNLYTQLSKERESEAREKTIAYLDSWLLKKPEKSD